MKNIFIFNIKRIALICLVSVLMAILLSGCSTEIKPKTPDGTYATQNRLSAIEYSLYMNKQLTAIVSQIQTRMIAVANSNEAFNPAESNAIQSSIDLISDAKDQIEVTYPSEGRDDLRTDVLAAVQLALDNLKSYKADYDNGADTSEYVAIFENDMNTLTGYATLYFE